MSACVSIPAEATGGDPHPTPEMPPSSEAGRMREPVRQAGHDTDWLISISDTRILFKLGRTAARELTRRPGFLAPVQLSRRCLCWWASEIDAYAASLQRQGAQRRTCATTTRPAYSSATRPRWITGTVRAARSRKERRATRTRRQTSGTLSPSASRVTATSALNLIWKPNHELDDTRCQLVRQVDLVTAP